MAQEDYVIADQTGVAFLSDLNDTLAAIVSNNSGATAPATTYAYMYWADTTAGILKQRNSADSAWIDILTLSTGLPAGLGASDSPTFVNVVAGNAATAWVNFNGTGTVAINDSYNVSSITDNAVGSYTPNFATTMANVNYVILISSEANAYGNKNFYDAGALKTATSCRVYSYSGDNAYEDSADYSVAILGG